MIRTASTFVAAFLLASLSLGYFRYQRQVGAANSSGQHYVVVDESLWQHALPDLGDLRVYSSDAESPYDLAVEWGSSQTEQKQFRVLQPGTVGGKTQFLLDMSGVSEYDRIELKLATKDFVAHARVEGQDDPHGAQWTTLGTTTLYDLSGEKLGRNSTLQIPLSTYKYLRVTVDSSLKPSDVKSGTAGITRAQKAVWRDLGEGILTQRNENARQDADLQRDRNVSQRNDTVLTFSVPKNVPFERIAFTIDPAQQNFLRPIEIQSDKDSWFGSGEISRIHMQRNGEKIDVDQTSLDLTGTGPATLKAIIHNGNDASLKITGAHLQQYERRIYFDSAAGIQPTLYYGDEKLAEPVYDYAKLFQKDANANQLQLHPEETNAAFTGRPDDRPWSERHPSVLWLAIIAAVAILGAIAIRSMKTPST
jgi:Protein of unknown function (DUF3999)